MLTSIETKSATNHSSFINNSELSGKVFSNLTKKIELKYYSSSLTQKVIIKMISVIIILSSPAGLPIDQKGSNV